MKHSAASLRQQNYLFHFIKRHTLVWQGTKFAVSLSGFLVTDISATVAPFGVTFCTMVHIGPRQIFSPFGSGTPGVPKIQNFVFLQSEDLEKGKSRRYNVK